MSTTVSFVPHIFDTGFGEELVYLIDGLDITQAAPPTPPPPTPPPPTPPLVNSRYIIRDMGYIMQKKPKPVFVVDKFILENTINLFFGKPGAGKTYGVFYMAACIATGKDWLGRKTSQRSVLVIDEDGGDWRCSYRLKEILLGLNKTTNAPIQYVSMAGFKLTNPKDVTEIEKLIDDTGARLVIFDCLAMFYTGKENDADTMLVVFNALRRIADKKGVTVIMIHHTDKKGEDYRGSSAIGGACDLTVKISQDTSDKKLLTYETTKTRDIYSDSFSARAEWLPDQFDPSEMTYKQVSTNDTVEPDGAGEKAIMLYFKTHKDGEADAIWNSSGNAHTNKKAFFKMKNEGKFVQVNHGRPARWALRKYTDEQLDLV